jgi:sulfur carrier protein
MDCDLGNGALNQQTMRLTVNGDPKDVPDGMTISALVESLALGGGPLAVERNGDVVPRKLHPTTTLSDGDVVEVVHFVGGG